MVFESIFTQQKTNQWSKGVKYISFSLACLHNLHLIYGFRYNSNAMNIAFVIPWQTWIDPRWLLRNTHNLSHFSTYNWPSWPKHPRWIKEGERFIWQKQAPACYCQQPLSHLPDWCVSLVLSFGFSEMTGKVIYTVGWRFCLHCFYDHLHVLLAYLLSDIPKLDFLLQQGFPFQLVTVDFRICEDLSCLQLDKVWLSNLCLWRGKRPLSSCFIDKKENPAGAC